jgi:cell division protein FtsB
MIALDSLFYSALLTLLALLSFLILYLSLNSIIIKYTILNVYNSKANIARANPNNSELSSKSKYFI